MYGVIPVLVGTGPGGQTLLYSIHGAPSFSHECLDRFELMMCGSMSILQHTANESLVSTMKTC